MKMEQEPTLPTNLEEGKLTDEQIKIQEKRDGVKYAQEQDKETGKWLPLRRVFDEGDIEEARHEMNISRGDSTFDPKGIKHPEKYVNIDGDLKKILEEKTNEGRSFDKIATIQSKTLGREVEVSWRMREGFHVFGTNPAEQLDWNYLSLDEKKKAVEEICGQPLNELIEKSRVLDKSSKEAFLENVKRLGL